ncbi:MAG: carboxy terminal-processing peptidase [Candidatus Marinamargulisbacteria bacterium]
MIRQLLFIIFAATSLLGNAATLNLEQQQKINQILTNTLTRYHYVDQSIDDNFSKRVFILFLKQLDPNKNFLTLNQMVELNAYEYKIDNDIRNNTFNFFNLAILRFKEQVQYSNSIYNTILKHPLDLEEAITIEVDPDKKKYVKNNAELTKRWKANTHYQVAQNYITLFKEKYPSENTLKMDKNLEAEARLKTKKELDRRFKRLLEKNDVDFFNAYMDALTRSFGPHTSYLPPEEKEDFDINMKGQLEGIGAVLREDDGYIKVVRIIPGSASWRQGELKAEDIILKVAKNESEEAISIVETPVREAVKLIRGPKGSTVVLTIKKPDGMIKNIPIQRDIVVIKSAYAKSGIFESNGNQFGYIYLPSFYRDFENNNNRNAASDIKAALTTFNQSNTNGLILDLRNNGGGSLRDAIEISGFFIPEGPIVQVTDSYDQKDTYNDKDKKTIFNQPLIVLVNKFSASASEIVSAALQDYDRAIILGDSHTFGKGTVQKVVDLDRIIFKRKNNLGYLKITIQEYFRITGKSTQFTGVIPDIIFPSQTDYLEVGEKELKFAFKGSTTSPSNFELWTNNQLEKDTVIKNSYQRLKQNQASKAIGEYNAFMKNQRELSTRSIRLSDLWENLQKVKEKNDDLDNLSVEKTFTSYASIEPKLDDQDETEKEEYTKWVKKFDKDHVLNEAFLILAEMNQTAQISTNE